MKSGFDAVDGSRRRYREVPEVARVALLGLPSIWSGKQPKAKVWAAFDRASPTHGPSWDELKTGKVTRIGLACLSTAVGLPVLGCDVFSAHPTTTGPRSLAGPLDLQDRGRVTYFMGHDEQRFADWTLPPWNEQGALGPQVARCSTFGHPWIHIARHPWID